MTLTTVEGQTHLDEDAAWRNADLTRIAALPPADVFTTMKTQVTGLSEAEARRRLEITGPNALPRKKLRALAVVVRQLNNPFLFLLAAAALASVIFGEHTDAIIILAIVALSVGLGFINEYRSERALEDLNKQMRRRAIAVRDGKAETVDVNTLVPGDVIVLAIGDIVPADARLVQTQTVECDEAILTGESLPAEKSELSPAADASSASTQTVAFMGTVISSGSARGIVVKTGAATMLGRIAAGLGRRPPVTAFEQGLRQFSRMLVRITAVFSTLVLVVNLVLHRSVFESLLFALAIAVAITPQLLPAIVTISLSVGAKHLAQKSVMVKRLVSIEDLGNVEVLFTDKTGTLTEGEITLAGAYDVHGQNSENIMQLGITCNSAVNQEGIIVGGNAMDVAIWRRALMSQALTPRQRIISQLPFDFVRRRMSVLSQASDGSLRLIVKGAPESILPLCKEVPQKAQSLIDDHQNAGERVIAVGSREMSGATAINAQDERDLELLGFLTFYDPPKPSAAASLARLNALGIMLKIATGDNERVAQKICRDLGIEVKGMLNAAQIGALSDAELRAALPQTTIFARVTPEQKSRLIRLQQSLGADVGFLGDGVNDAVALHDADVGISVDSAADVAKEAADIVLLDKDLGILGDGVAEGRRIFANTIKYLLMGTSSNFGNMISTGTASLILSFLPMLPSQILLNNLLYDASEITIPTDNVDADLVQRPAHWDMKFIQRFMILFGTINSCFDFSIFAVLIWVLHAGPALFRSGFFVESFVTQTLIIFAIRTRHVPFFRSRPSLPLTVTTLVAAFVGLALPFSPLAPLFGFAVPSLRFFVPLVAIIVAAYFGLVEVAKVFFYRSAARRTVTIPSAVD